MNGLMIAFCLCLSGGGDAPPRLFAEDRWKHFFASFVVTTVSASGARLAGLDEDASLITGVAVGAGAGLWKEIRDARTPEGRFSTADLLWDAAGVGTGAVVVAQSK